MTTLSITTPHGLARAELHCCPQGRAALLLGHGAGGGTAATTTPWVRHSTRRVLACKNTGVVPRSRPRQRRGSELVS